MVQRLGGRGFIGGFVWGAIVGVAMMAAVSLMISAAPAPQLGAAVRQETQTPAATASVDTKPVLDADLAIDVSAQTPQSAKVQRKQVSPLITASLPHPQAGLAAHAPAPPQSASLTSDLDFKDADKIALGPQVPMEPATPVGEAKLPIITAPAAQKITPPVAPILTDENTGSSRKVAAVTPAADALAPTPKPTAHNFKNPDDLPLMSIVLIDNGSMSVEDTLSPAALGDFPGPLSIAVDASLPDASERAAAWYAQGFDVLAVPAAASADSGDDVHDILARAFLAVPNATGILENARMGLRDNAQTYQRARAFLNRHGHGLILRSRAARIGAEPFDGADLPTASVFRDFDRAGQSPQVIRRFLDQAAFRAGRSGKIVMLGRLQPDTINALQAWSAQESARHVTLAPVSAVLSPPRAKH